MIVWPGVKKKKGGGGKVRTEPAFSSKLRRGSGPALSQEKINPTWPKKERS